MSKYVYLIDSNCLITAKNEYYPFDFAPGFWKQLSEELKRETVLIHRAVFDELIKGEDELKSWIQENAPKKKISLKDEASMEAFAQVINYVKKSEFYNDNALRKWSETGVADPQLVASALAFDYTIVTKETAKPRNAGRKSSNPKIPDVAADLGVRCITPFQMMRELGFKL